LRTLRLVPALVGTIAQGATPGKGRLRRYRLTQAEYAAMLARQRGRCAVCGDEPRRQRNGKDGLLIDHDHATGRVRGLLCARCNRDMVVIDYPAERRERLTAYAIGGLGW
jgi:hypothetical protein